MLKQHQREFKNKSSCAIVLSAGPNGLGVVRGLHRKGVNSIVIGYTSYDPALLSRFPLMKYALKKEDSQAKKEELISLLMRHKNSRYCLIPTSDWFVTFMCEYRIKLEPYFDFVIPSNDVIDMLIDKRREIDTIGKIVPTPKSCSRLPESSKSLLQLLSLPIIIKPRSHKYFQLGKKNEILLNKQDVESFYNHFSNHLNTVVAQEIIAGPDDNLWVCNCVFNEKSELVQALVFRRLRLSPPHYGVTSYARSESNTTIVDLVKVLGKKLKYRGPAMVEFKYNENDNEYQYIELNPRLGLANFFDTNCGVNNVIATYLLAVNKTLDKNIIQQKDDVIFLSFFEDFYARKTDGESLMQIAKHYLSNFRYKHVFIFYVWYDPWPALFVAKKQLLLVIKSLWRKLTHRNV